MPYRPSSLLFSWLRFRTRFPTPLSTPPPPPRPTETKLFHIGTFLVEYPFWDASFCSFLPPSPRLSKIVSFEWLYQASPPFFYPAPVWDDDFDIASGYSPLHRNRNPELFCAASFIFQLINRLTSSFARILVLLLFSIDPVLCTRLPFPDFNRSLCLRSRIPIPVSRLSAPHPLRLCQACSEMDDRLGAKGFPPHPRPPILLLKHPELSWGSASKIVLQSGVISMLSSHGPDVGRVSFGLSAGQFQVFTASAFDLSRSQNLYRLRQQFPYQITQIS